MLGVVNTSSKTQLLLENLNIQVDKTKRRRGNRSRERQSDLAKVNLMDSYELLPATFRGPKQNHGTVQTKDDKVSAQIAHDLTVRLWIRQQTHARV